MRRFAAALVALALIGTACSSSMAIDEYAALIEDRAAAYADEHEDLGRRHLADLEAAIADLQDSMEGERLATAALDETARRSAKLFAGIGDALGRYIDELDEIEPPRSVSAEHVAYVEALKGSSEGIGPLISTLTEAVSFDEINRAFASSGYADSSLRVAAACLRLEEVLEGQDLDADLPCEEAG
ncbi:MAG: hypothetical protein ABFR89_11295 [Actinomycetota bacterium]